MNGLLVSRGDAFGARGCSLTYLRQGLMGQVGLPGGSCSLRDWIIPGTPPAKPYRPCRSVPGPPGLLCFPCCCRSLAPSLAKPAVNGEELNLSRAGRARQLCGVCAKAFALAAGMGRGMQQAQCARGPCGSHPSGSCSPTAWQAQGRFPITYCQVSLNFMAGFSVLFLDFLFPTCLA